MKLPLYFQMLKCLRLIMVLEADTKFKTASVTEVRNILHVRKLGLQIFKEINIEMQRGSFNESYVQEYASIYKISKLP
jgi:hypothetical protein